MTVGARDHTAGKGAKVKRNIEVQKINAEIDFSQLAKVLAKEYIAYKESEKSNANKEKTA